MTNDTDGDGIVDYFEKKGMYLPNGNIVFTDYIDDDSDDDGLLDGEEVIPEIKAKPIYSYTGGRNRYCFEFESYPDNIDSDNDRLDDFEEYCLDTNSLNTDSDNDKLDDNSEVDLWFDPLNANPDGDSYSDYEENERDTSPFVYHMNETESFLAFLKGAAHGEFETASSTEMLLGQVATCFVPFVADARDYIANVFINCDTGAALANLGGFLLEFAPGLGVAGDVPKALLKVGNFVAKYADDAPKVFDAIIQTSKFFKNNDEFFLVLASKIPTGSMDNIVDSIKSGSKITKADYLTAQKLCDAAGHGFDVGNSLKSQKLIDELINSDKKFTMSDLVAITKTPEGKLVWLEIGKETGKKGSSGLLHIETHASQFAQKGISKEEIPEFIMAALSEGRQVGTQNTRTIYEVVFKGRTQRVAIDVADNGYIVGANPKSLD